MFLVGFGQDSHRFEKKGSDKKLILGGVIIENEIGLEGDSDGDVAIHSICRAIEQTLGNPDFHNYSEKMAREGIKDSIEYLKVAISHIKERDLSINNLGITFECKKPRINFLNEKIKKRLADILGIKIMQIGINASSGDGLTAFGKGKGIQCFAIISLIKNNG